jgi:hypothetical protein
MCIDSETGYLPRLPCPDILILSAVVPSFCLAFFVATAILHFVDVLSQAEIWVETLSDFDFVTVIEIESASVFLTRKTEHNRDNK